MCNIHKNFTFHPRPKTVVYCSILLNQHPIFRLKSLQFQLLSMHILHFILYVSFCIFRFSQMCSPYAYTFPPEMNAPLFYLNERKTSVLHKKTVSPLFSRGDTVLSWIEFQSILVCDAPVNHLLSGLATTDASLAQMLLFDRHTARGHACFVLHF